jgi:hypothetical protein
MSTHSPSSFFHPLFPLRQLLSLSGPHPVRRPTTRAHPLSTRRLQLGAGRVPQSRRPSWRTGTAPSPQLLRGLPLKRWRRPQSRHIDLTTDFMRLLTLPLPLPPTASSSLGKIMFERMLCTTCHTPAMTTGPNLHDGRAPTVEAAIRAHDGRGLASRTRYQSLPGNLRQNVLDSLNSL